MMNGEAKWQEAGLTIRTDGAVRILTLGRTERKNALSRALVAALVAELAEAGSDAAVGAVVLAGEGDTFCAGADLKDMAASDADGAAYVSPYLRPGSTVVETIVALPKPVIAAVDGPALAGGMELVLACDLRVAGADAWFSLPEAQRGMAAQFASVVLPRTVPRAVAAEWLYTGRRVPVSEAHAAGLLNRVTEPGAALDTTLALAAEVAANAPLSLGRMKRLAWETWDMTLAEALRHHPEPDPYTSEDRKEGARAFLEKRRPLWRGR